VNRPDLKTPLARALSLGVSAVLIAGLSLAGASAAHAAPEDTYTVSGTVVDGSAAPLEGVSVSIRVPVPPYSSYMISATTDATGAFELTNVPEGTHHVSFQLTGYGYESTDVTALADVVLPPKVMLPLTDNTGATATISGSGEIGSTLTVSTTGWPADAEFTYQWLAPETNSSGDIIGAVASTYVITADEVGREVTVFVYGRVPGVSAPSEIIASNAILAYDPEKPISPPPADLDDYLLNNGSTPESQTTAGLPSGPLNPGVAQTADLPWAAADSFVDVYVFSTPVRVGVFPVVGGVAKISLSPTVLGQLSTGGHTLVATGQTSGAVQSLALSIGLAATGADAPTAPLLGAALLLLAGSALVIARRRVSHSR